MTNKTHYEILGVDITSSHYEIEKAYRQLYNECLSEKCHDLYIALRQELDKKEMSYWILSDKKLRDDYDFLLRSNENEVYRAEHNGADISTPIAGERAFGYTKIDIKTALQGGTVDIKYIKRDYCLGCMSKGTIAKERNCDVCKGKGTKQYADGGTVCRKCTGSGRIPRSKCKRCKGLGWVNNECKFTIEIRPGTFDGCCYVYTGKGGIGLYGAESGDLKITINVNHPQGIKINQADIVMPLRLNFVEAILGRDVSRPSAIGNLDAYIPPHTQTGTLIKTDQAGFLEKDLSKRGAIYYEVIICLPKSAIPTPILGQLVFALTR